MITKVFVVCLGHGTVHSVHWVALFVVVGVSGQLLGEVQSYSSDHPHTTMIFLSGSQKSLTGSLALRQHSTKCTHSGVLSPPPLLFAKSYLLQPLQMHKYVRKRQVGRAFVYLFLVLLTGQHSRHNNHRV